MMTKFYTIPGYGDSDSEHWQTYFDKKLDNCQRIDESLSDENLSDTILITHSLGGITLAHWVQKYGKTIKGALIVAPPGIEYPYEDLGLESFIPIPQISLTFPSILVCSSNDNWMSLERSNFFANSWGSELVILKNAGHINGDSGYRNWDDGLEILNKLA